MRAAARLRGRYEPSRTIPYLPVPIPPIPSHPEWGRQNHSGIQQVHLSYGIRCDIRPIVDSERAMRWTPFLVHVPWSSRESWKPTKSWAHDPNPHPGCWNSNTATPPLRPEPTATRRRGRTDNPLPPRASASRATTGYGFIQRTDRKPPKLALCGWFRWWWRRRWWRRGWRR